MSACEALVFENSTACTSRTSRASAREVTEPVSSLRGDFELKLETEPLATRPSGLTAKVFTESLILAQDERWRRA